MGRITRHPIAEWRKRYSLDCFVETGTWRGDGVQAALDAGFERVYSVEQSPMLARAARERFRDCPSVGILTGNSPAVLRWLVPQLEGRRILWWLDAHLPERYFDAQETAHRCPLVYELQHTAERPGGRQDVFVADDLRLLKRGPYASGNFRGHLFPGLDDVVALLDSQRRFVVEDTRDEGYLVARPCDEPAK